MFVFFDLVFRLVAPDGAGACALGADFPLLYLDKHKEIETGGEDGSEIPPDDPESA
jgi:hypothetical protein